MPLHKAVRISMSIPGYFQPVKLAVRVPDEDLFVDGGLLDNFPINHFEHEHPGTRALGLRLVSTSDKSRTEINGDLDMILDIIDAMCLQMERNALADIWNETLVNIETGSISSFDFGITLEQKKELIKTGYNTMMKFILSD